MAASSPKKSPGPSVLTRRPCCVTATEPDRMRKNSRPMPAFPGQDLASAHLDALGKAGHLLELGLRAVPKVVHQLQTVNGRLSP